MLTILVMFLSLTSYNKAYTEGTYEYDEGNFLDGRMKLAFSLLLLTSRITSSIFRSQGRFKFTDRIWLAVSGKQGADKPGTLL